MGMLGVVWAFALTRSHPQYDAYSAINHMLDMPKMFIWLRLIIRHSADLLLDALQVAETTHITLVSTQ